MMHVRGKTEKEMANYLAEKAKKHWACWLPKKTAELKEAGTFEIRALEAAAMAQSEIKALMDSGFQEHEAEEVVLPEYILLTPERGRDLTPVKKMQTENGDALMQKSMSSWVRQVKKRRALCALKELSPDARMKAIVGAAIRSGRLVMPRK